jgi:MerR family transcriptional regulator, redox-sensitive transcriptional activator SoxR
MTAAASRDHPEIKGVLTIGELSERTGVAPSALRFYEDNGLICSQRSSGGQRRYHREMIRRVSFVRIAQQVGLSLAEIRECMASLPDGRTPDRHDWEQVASTWRPRLDHQIALLERLRDRLGLCIGCGCLSLDLCPLANPWDCLAAEGSGPRLLLHD